MRINFMFRIPYMNDNFFKFDINYVILICCKYVLLCIKIYLSSD